MGTYLEFEQPDLAKLDATNEFLYEIVDPSDDTMPLWMYTQEDQTRAAANGYAGACPAGRGDIKLSGDDYVDRLYRPLGVFEHLVKARDQFGLKITVPTNADDYMDDDEIAHFIPLDQFRAMQEKEEQEYEVYLETRKAAIKKAQEEFTSGLFLCDTYSPSKYWVMYGNVTHPEFLMIEFEANEKTHSEIFRDKDGQAVLLIPLMRLTGDERGSQEVLDALDNAWHRCGLRTDPRVLMVACYRHLPKEVIVAGKAYKPESVYIPHLPENSPFATVEGDKVVVREVENNTLPVEIRLKPIFRGKDKEPLYVASYTDLARIFEQNIRTE